MQNTEEFQVFGGRKSWLAARRSGVRVPYHPHYNALNCNGLWRFSFGCTVPLWWLYPSGMHLSLILCSRRTVAKEVIFMSSQWYLEQLQTAEWDAKRKKVWRRDNHTCRECGKTGCQVCAHHLRYQSATKVGRT